MEIDKRLGCYTFNAFMHYAQEWIENEPDRDFTLSMTDVRGFKHLHKKYGEKVYDLLRQEISYINSLYKEHVIIGSFNNDQLIILYPTPLKDFSEEEKEMWYEETVASMSEKLSVTLKVGVCEHIAQDIDLTTHINNVLAALNEAKKIYNRHSRFVGKELLEKLQRKERIEELMEDALRSGQMEVYYQPKHDAKTEEMVGAEALLRWNSPELGFVSPGEFIPIFEENRFVAEADYFVWNETCRNLRKWQDMGLSVVPISVNTSRQDFSEVNLDKRIFAPMYKYNINYSLMHIEITESLFSDLSTEAIDILSQFRNRGIKVELDDFGTGYSSLNLLSELPIDIVKFDMSFVRRLNDQRKQKLMKGCVAILKDLGLTSIAEGVEDAKTRLIIANMGIDAIQGYYYSKPLSVLEFEAYLATVL